jgi:probable DNA metabolism protein
MSNGRDVIYLYDGSFEGLLSAIFESYARHELPLSITEDSNVQQALFCDYYFVTTDEEKSERVFRSIQQKVSPVAMENIYYTYLSCAPGKGRLCLDYVRAGLRFGPGVDSHLTVDCVNTVLLLSQNVSHEAHQYTGFVRFSELDGGIYYSEIEPKNHVLPILAQHFTERLPQMPWMIHDLNRHLCLVYNGASCYLAPTSSMPKIQYSEEEQAYRKLWRKFYETVEIKERSNERCRRGHMPKRYWKHLTEFNELF